MVVPELRLVDFNTYGRGISASPPPHSRRPASHSTNTNTNTIFNIHFSPSPAILNLNGSSQPPRVDSQWRSRTAPRVAVNLHHRRHHHPRSRPRRTPSSTIVRRVPLATTSATSDASMHGAHSCPGYPRLECAPVGLRGRQRPHRRELRPAKPRLQAGRPCRQRGLAKRKS